MKVFFTSLFLLSLQCALHSYAQDKPRFKVLETPAGVRINNLGSNGHVVGYRDGYGIFVWSDQNRNHQMDSDEFRYSQNTQYNLADAAVNANGVVIYSILTYPPSEGILYLWKGDELAQVRENYIQDLSINSHEQIAGAVRSQIGHTTIILHAAVRLADTLQFFPLLGGYGFDTLQPQNNALGINDSGVVVGWSNAGPKERPGDDPYAVNLGPIHAFVWKDQNGNQSPEYDEMLDIGLSKELSSSSVANGINNDGLVVGGITSPRLIAFTFQDKNNNYTVDVGEIIILPATDETIQYEAQVVNNNGVICGRALFEGEYPQALIWMDETMIFLKDCVDEQYESFMREPVAVSDDNWILCNSYSYELGNLLLIPEQSYYPDFRAYQ